MKHLDLFSGIGGFAYAAQQVWENYETVAFVEWDHFCQQVLAKNFPGVPIHGDIRSFTYTPNKGLEGGKREEYQGRGEGLTCDLITGGFPCQPFSSAGRRKGTDDDRHLWPEMFRVIREWKPRWVIGENVAGLLTWSEGMVLKQITTDLENEGYEVQCFVIPAISVNAPHRRDRVWIVGHSQHNGQHEPQDTQSSQERDGSNQERQKQICQPKRANSLRFETESWSQDWFEVATRLCRVDDGVSNRVDRLKSLGNAIVPQVAMQIMKGIKEVEST